MKRLLATSAIALGLATAAHAEGQLNLYVWAESIAPELITAFEQEYDVKVNIDSFTSNEDMLTKLQAGASGYDLAMASQHFVRILIDEGLIQNFGANQLDAWGNVSD